MGGMAGFMRFVAVARGMGIGSNAIVGLVAKGIVIEREKTDREVGGCDAIAKARSLQTCSSVTPAPSAVSCLLSLSVAWMNEITVYGWASKGEQDEDVMGG